MQTNKTGVNGADPAENQTPSYSAEGNEVNPWPHSCSIMQCKLCLPRETELAAYKYIDINPSQACRGKVNTCIVALVVKIKLKGLAKGFVQMSQKDSGAGCAISSAII